MRCHYTLSFATSAVSSATANKKSIRLWRIAAKPGKTWRDRSMNCWSAIGLAGNLATSYSTGFGNSADDLGSKGSEMLFDSSD